MTLWCTWTYQTRAYLHMSWKGSQTIALCHKFHNSHDIVIDFDIKYCGQYYYSCTISQFSDAIETLSNLTHQILYHSIEETDSEC